jgi:hypothetical protein
MDVPAPAGAVGTRGSVTAVFRLDSLSRDGTHAFVSMRGTVSRSAPDKRAGSAARVDGTGALTGRLVIDRRRGWLSDARTTLTVKSTLTPASPSAAPTMRFRMRVQEWLRAVER